MDQVHDWGVDGWMLAEQAWSITNLFYTGITTFLQDTAGNHEQVLESSALQLE